MRRSGFWAWGLAWLVCLCAPPTLGMVWDQVGYPTSDALGILVAIGAGVATLAWGFLLGRLGEWLVLLGSVVVGAVVLTVLGEISLKLTYRGDPSGPGVALVFYVVQLGLVLAVAGLVGMVVRRLRQGSS